MKKQLVFLTIILLIIVSINNIFAQKKSKSGKICGNPNLKCKGSEGFEPFELTFELPKNPVIAESEQFYSIILKSIKIKPDTNCDNLITEQERLETQKLFPNNKVFALKCSEPGDIYYTNVANDVSFMGIYAGKTLAEAQKFLKIVQSTAKYGKVSLRKMQAGINGT